MASGLAEMGQRRNSAKRSYPANCRTPPLPLGPDAADKFVCAHSLQFSCKRASISYISFGTDRPSALFDTNAFARVALIDTVRDEDPLIIAPSRRPLPTRNRAFGMMHLVRLPW